MKSLNNKTSKHNREVIKRFMKEDMTTGESYFMFLKMNNGEVHCLTNLNDKGNLNQVKEEFNNFIKKVAKVRATK